MFPTGAGLAPKEVIQAKSKQDAHEAVCATRKTSRDMQRGEGEPAESQPGIFPVSSLCSVSVPLDNVKQSSFPCSFCSLSSPLLVSTKKGLEWQDSILELCVAFHPFSI